MSGYYRSLEYLSTKMNSAINTKQSIITVASSHEHIIKKVKEKEERNKNNINIKEEYRDINFDPREVEPLVLKKEDEKER